MADKADYPNPQYDEQEHGRKFNLDALPEPPEDFKPLGFKVLYAYTKTRKPKVADFERWMDFYFWGIETDLGRVTAHTIDDALRKLLYYTAPEHHPKNYTEFNECEDELKDLGLWYSPVSQFYPTLPTRSARLRANVVRPADAPAQWKHTWVEQALLSSGPAYNSDIAAGGLSTFALGLARSSGLPEEIKDKILETMQRAIIGRFAYEGLQRHPSAAPLAPLSYLTAASLDDLFQAEIRSFPAVSHRMFGNSHPGSVGSLWDTLSSTLGQFLIDYEESTIFCECMKIPDTAKEITTHYMTLPPFKSDSAGVTIHTLFERTCNPNPSASFEDCGKANSVQVQRGISRLPLRLAVRLAPTASVLDHAKDVTFKYREIDLKAGGARDLSATYRWLGGIYHDNKTGTYSVFWSDAKTGESNDQGGVRIYGGSSHGLIAAATAAVQASRATRNISLEASHCKKTRC
ncbi:hypothetical protein BDV19DRAFT_394248 [Aspergillus venezuelensis]